MAAAASGFSQWSYSKKQIQDYKLWALVFFVTKNPCIHFSFRRMGWEFWKLLLMIPLIHSVPLISLSLSLVRWVIASTSEGYYKNCMWFYISTLYWNKVRNQEIVIIFTIIIVYQIWFFRIRLLRLSMAA